MPTFRLAAAAPAGSGGWVARRSAELERQGAEVDDVDLLEGAVPEHACPTPGPTRTWNSPSDVVWSEARAPRVAWSVIPSATEWAGLIGGQDVRQFDGSSTWVARR